MNDDIWSKLYAAARRVQNPRTITPFLDAGGVAAALYTKKGNIYTGVCIDSCCSLGMCAERAAIAAMITGGESEIEKIVAIMEDVRFGMPCGACRELMMQLSPNAGQIEILADLASRKTVRLAELMPDWWGNGRYNREN